MDGRQALAALLDDVVAGTVTAEDANQRWEHELDWPEGGDSHLPRLFEEVHEALPAVALEQEGASEC